MATAEQLKKMGIKQEDYIQSPGVIEDPNKTVKAAPTTVVKQPVLNETNPQYAALIQKGYTPEQISNAWKGIQEKQAKVKPTPKVDTISATPASVDTTGKKKGEVGPDVTTTSLNKKEGEPSYTDISPERQKQIIDNLEGYFAQNPNSFNNFETFKQNYSFDKRVPQQQIWLKNRYDSKKDAIATNSANQVKLTSLTNLNDASLANISSADAVFLMNNDTTAYLRYQDALKKKNNLAMINSQEEEPEEDPYSLANIMKSFGIDMGTAEAISTETAEPRKELDDAKMEYDKAKREYDNILTDTQKQYQGETSSFINAMAAKKQRELLPDLQTKLDAYNTKVASYNNVLEERKVAAAEKSQKLQDFSNAFAIYKANYEMKSGSEDANLAKTWTDPITGTGYQWNTKTNRYDIPIGGGAGGEQSTTNNGMWNKPSTSDMRTDRHNNPTAFTTAVAKQAGLVEGVDYEAGDSFDNNKDGKIDGVTARLLGDPLEITRRVIDKIGFTTAAGKPRWSYLSSLGVSNESWNKMSVSEKNGIIAKMYQHEGGEGTIDVGQGGTDTSGGDYTPQQKAAMDKYINDPTPINKAKYLTKNGLDESDINAYKPETSYEDFTNEQIALAQIPTQLRNSEVELKRYVEGIKLGLKQGKDPYQIADQLMGYNITTPDSFSKNIRTMMAALPESSSLSKGDVADIARLVNGKNYIQAIQKIESIKNNGIKKLEGDQYISESNVKTIAQRVDELYDIIGQLSKDKKNPLGGFNGTLEKWLGRFKGTDAANLANKATRLMTTFNVQNFGTVLTSKETDLLNNLAPKIYDSTSNFLTKAGNFKIAAFQELNNQRTTYGLAPLGDKSLQDWKERVKLYQGGNMNRGTNTIGTKPKKSI